MSPEEVLAQYLDPETGGTLPREYREAGLAVLDDLENLRERWACVGCGRTPDGGKSGDIYVSICHGCHRCNACAEPMCTICGDEIGLRQRAIDLKAQLAEAREWSAKWKALARFRGWPESKHEQTRRQLAEARAGLKIGARLLAGRDKQIGALQAEVERLRERLRIAAQERADARLVGERAEARLREVLLATARVIRSDDGKPCFCDDYKARRRAGYGHAPKCELARAALAAAQGKP